MGGEKKETDFIVQGHSKSLVINGQETLLIMAGKYKTFVNIKLIL